jgi:hypothetical protein
MWRLSMRENKIRDWVELGTFAGIGPAARRVLELERDPTQPIGAVFFRVYADPVMEKSDAEILSRLEYQGANSFYVLTRHMQ